MIGSLGPAQGPQMQFLQNQINQLTAEQRLVLLTHHNGLNLNGSVPLQTDQAYTLWQQVTQAVTQLPAAANKNVLWYFGHVHVGAVYTPHHHLSALLRKRHNHARPDPVGDRLTRTATSSRAHWARR